MLQFCARGGAPRLITSADYTSPVGGQGGGKSRTRVGETKGRDVIMELSLITELLITESVMIPPGPYSTRHSKRLHLIPDATRNISHVKATG